MVLEITFIALLFLGIFFTAIPTIPGIGYMFLIVLTYGIIDKFETLTPWHLLIFGAIVLIATAADYMSGLIGAKFGGASKISLFYGLIGLVVGFLLFPPFGLFLGLFLAIFLSEIMQRKGHEHAFKAAFYAFLGIVSGMIFSIFLAIVFFLTFVFIILP